eukprot:TRINITY_DN1669_c0_g1_i1.p1 TRINITY_DN1669_c0_g1~~TRINITY_DN1669_c0_g1_i1.p1  ORF type:complete len:988 (+),score=218.03 TRINITY_DN1669_c0_g1_i1:319-3282(+)
MTRFFKVFIVVLWLFFEILAVVSIFSGKLINFYSFLQPSDDNPLVCGFKSREVFREIETNSLVQVCNKFDGTNALVILDPSGSLSITDDTEIKLITKANNGMILFSSDNGVYKANGSVNDEGWPGALNKHIKFLNCSSKPRFSSDNKYAFCKDVTTTNQLSILCLETFNIIAGNLELNSIDMDTIADVIVSDKIVGLVIFTPDDPLASQKLNFPNFQKLLRFDRETGKAKYLDSSINFKDDGIFDAKSVSANFDIHHNEHIMVSLENIQATTSIVVDDVKIVFLNVETMVYKTIKKDEISKLKDKNVTCGIGQGLLICIEHDSNGHLIEIFLFKFQYSSESPEITFVTSGSQVSASAKSVVPVSSREAFHSQLNLGTSDIFHKVNGNLPVNNWMPRIGKTATGFVLINLLRGMEVSVFDLPEVGLDADIPEKESSVVKIATVVGISGALLIAIFACLFARSTTRSAILPGGVDKWEEFPEATSIITGVIPSTGTGNSTTSRHSLKHSRITPKSIIEKKFERRFFAEASNRSLVRLPANLGRRVANNGNNDDNDNDSNSSSNYMDHLSLNSHINSNTGGSINSNPHRHSLGDNLRMKQGSISIISNDMSNLPSSPQSNLEQSAARYRDSFFFGRNGKKPRLRVGGSMRNIGVANNIMNPLPKTLVPATARSLQRGYSGNRIPSPNGDDLSVITSMNTESNQSAIIRQLSSRSAISVPRKKFILSRKTSAEETHKRNNNNNANTTNDNNYKTLESNLLTKNTTGNSNLTSNNNNNNNSNKIVDGDLPIKTTAGNEAQKATFLDPTEKMKSSNITIGTTDHSATNNNTKSSIIHKYSNDYSDYNEEEENDGEITPITPIMNRNSPIIRELSSSSNISPNSGTTIGKREQFHEDYNEEINMKPLTFLNDNTSNGHNLSLTKTMVIDSSSKATVLNENKTSNGNDSLSLTKTMIMDASSNGETDSISSNSSKPSKRSKSYISEVTIVGVSDD